MMPAGSRLVLQAVLELLSTIHAYQSCATRLAQLFAPALLWGPNGQPPNDQRAVRAIELLIMLYGDLFTNGSAVGNAGAAPSSAMMDMTPPMQSAPPPRMSQAASGRNGAPAPRVASPAPDNNDPFGYREDGIVFKNWSRDDAEAKLATTPGGAYLVRPSSQPNCLSVSYKAADTGRIGHLLLSKPSASVPGWTTDGRPRPYPSIRDLLKSLPYGLELNDPIVK